MKIASWNINSVRARLDNLIAWMQETDPDVVLLQETKCLAEQFPREPLENLGYTVVVKGQKSYNGVAILSKLTVEDVRTSLPGDENDVEARYLEAVVGGNTRVASLYVPNGQEVGAEKYFYKLRFFERLSAHFKDVLSYKESFVVGGDYNVAPTDYDVYDPILFKNRLSVTPQERAGFHSLLNLGFQDAIRVLYPEDKADNTALYTWWDYRQAGFSKNHGLRIDHLLLSPQAGGRLFEAGIDRFVRAQVKPSDHAPVWCVLKQ